MTELFNEQLMYIGRPCKNGHRERYIKGSNCVQCSREHAKTQRDYQKTHRALNRTKLKHYNAIQQRRARFKQSIKDYGVFPYNLTVLQIKILREFAEGLTLQEVAEALDRNAHTVKYHQDKILKKCHAPNMTNAVAKVSGWINLLQK